MRVMDMHLWPLCAGLGTMAQAIAPKKSVALADGARPCHHTAQLQHRHPLLTPGNSLSQPKPSQPFKTAVRTSTHLPARTDWLQATPGNGFGARPCRSCPSRPAHWAAGRGGEQAQGVASSSWLPRLRRAGDRSLPPPPPLDPPVARCPPNTGRRRRVLPPPPAASRRHPARAARPGRACLCD